MEKIDWIVGWQIWKRILWWNSLENSLNKFNGKKMCGQIGLTHWVKKMGGKNWVRKLWEKIVGKIVWKIVWNHWWENCTLYVVQCTVYIVQCTVYSLQCSVYNIQQSSAPQFVEGVPVFLSLGSKTFGKAPALPHPSRRFQSSCRGPRNGVKFGCRGPQNVVKFGCWGPWNGAKFQSWKNENWILWDFLKSKFFLNI